MEDFDEEAPWQLTREQVLKAFERVEPYLKNEESDELKILHLEEQLGKQKKLNRELRRDLDLLAGSS